MIRPAAPCVLAIVAASSGEVGVEQAGGDSVR